ncbi:hypothetical protein KLP28_12690 [Nocardioidaceae bacterium]|nr:hypothetical protein KLP28_12690 [Nocardioidaceae bacterium]
MYHPEQTWSVLHDERRTALAAARRGPRCADAPTDRPGRPGGPGGPAGPAAKAAPIAPPRRAVTARPLVVAARVRRALAVLVTA